MNYYEARQRRADGRWDFTVLNDGNIRSCGYCTPWEEILRGRQRVVEMGLPTNPHHDALVDGFKGKFHGTGHETPEEAAECYKEYVLDIRTNYTAGTRVPHPCEAKDCKEHTSLGANADGRVFWLCNAHRNRETVADLFKAPFKIVSSY